MNNQNQSEVKVTYTYRDKSRGSLHFTSEKQESPDLEPWNEYVLKSDYDKLIKENAILREALRKISKGTYEANPWSVVPSREALLALEVLKEVGEE